MAVVLMPSGPDAGLVWHASAPLREQRLMAGGAGVLWLANREVLAFDAPRWELGDTPGLRLSTDGCWAHADPGWGAALVPRLRSSLGMGVWLRADLSVVWRGARLPRLAPDDAVACNLSPVPDGKEWIVSRATAARLSSPPPLADQPVDAAERPVGLWAYEALRIEAGVPRVGLDLPLTGPVPHDPLPGGGSPLVRLLLDTDDLPAAGTPITLGGEVVGRLGSSAEHERWGPVALALLRPGLPPRAVLTVGADATAVVW